MAYLWLDPNGAKCDGFSAGSRFGTLIWRYFLSPGSGHAESAPATAGAIMAPVCHALRNGE